MAQRRAHSRVLNTVELTMCLHHDTGASILVSDDGNRAKAVFLPKSQIEFERTGKTMPETGGRSEGYPRDIVTVDVPQWLAEKEGLV